MANFQFKVQKKSREPFTFTLDGDDFEYHFTPRKQTGMISSILTGEEPDPLTQMKDAFDWLGSCLTEDGNKRIIERFKDPEDDLDEEALGNLIKNLTEAMAGRPIT